MPEIKAEQALSIPAAPAREAFLEILNAIANEAGDWKDFALHADFGALGLPDAGFVAVPVRISDIREIGEPRPEVRFKIHSRRLPDAFPVFDGAAGIDGTGPSSALLWLGGEYQVPLRALGDLINALVGHRAAETSLRNFLRDMAEAVSARVERREFEQIRFRTIFNPGA